MEQSFVHVEWDSKFFGFGVARIVHPMVDESELSQTLKMLRDSNYHMIYWQTPIDNHQSIHIAQAQGGFLADEKVTYVKELVRTSNSRGISTYTTSPYTGSAPDCDMIKLALLSGEYSRFRVDPKFPQELFEKLFTCWIVRSVSKEISSEVLVVKEHNILLGMITLGAKGERADIGLVAVAEHARGKGIGKSLVTDADRYFVEKNYDVAQVVTQRGNFGACKLYESCGYKIEKTENVFHFWL